jgi:hypothetical protein
MRYYNPLLKPIFVWVDVNFKKDLEHLAVSKRMTLSSLIQSASMEYLRREVREKESSA